MWDCELLLHRSQPKPGPAPVSLLGRFDVCSIPVKRALLSIAPCSVLPGTASRAGLVNFVHACLDSECAADFVRRLRQDPGMRWLPSQVLDRFLLGVADADARGHGRKPMPTSMPRLIAWAADAAVAADPLSKGAAVYEVASLVWRLARHVDFSVKDLQWLGGFLSLGPQASDAELQLKWLDEPNLPPAWAIPLVQGWLNHAVQTPEPSAHLLACIRAVERHLDALLAQRVAGLRLTSQDAIDRWREERGH